MSSKLSSLLALLVALIALGAVFLRAPEAPAPVAPKETAYERVMRTKTLRCAYFVWKPFFMKDPNTGVVSGFVPEFFERLGQDLSLKIEYTEEVNYAQMFEGFAAGRYDAVCGPLTPTPGRTLVADFTDPIAYAFYNVYAREGDARFDAGLSAVDDEPVRIAVYEGELTATIAPARFPKAKLVTLSNMGDGSSLLMELVTQKADAILTDVMSAQLFSASNPGKIRLVPGGPAALLASSIAIPLNEPALKAMLNTSFAYLNQTGFVASLVKKYGAQGVLYLPKTSYEVVP